MKIELINEITEMAVCKFCIYLPQITINKKYRADLGGEYKQTVLDFSTKLSIMNTKDSSDFIVRFLGFGFRFYVKDNHDNQS